MKKFVFFCFIFFYFVDLYNRVLLAPSIDNYLWYETTIEYPIEFYYYNRRANFCWDIGACFLSRFANKASICDLFNKGDNLSTLFHGADTFFLYDFQPLTANIVKNKGEYVFLPDYVFSESRCQINIQLSRDFEYYDDQYIRSTLRFIFPFVRQSVDNIASGNMYYNTSAAGRNKKTYHSNDTFVKRPEVCAKSIDSKEKSISLGNKKNFDGRVKTSTNVAGQKVFAIQASYIRDSLQQGSTLNSIFSYQPNQINLPYMVINKNCPNASYLADQVLSLEDICHSWSLITQPNQTNLFTYSQLTGVPSVNQVFLADGQTKYSVANTYPDDNTQNNVAFVTLYSYPEQSANNGFYVSGQFGIPYPVAVNPDYIADLEVGDLSSSSLVVYGDGGTGVVSPSTVLSQNTVIRLLATGNFGDDHAGDPSYVWNRKKIIFDIPPVVAQYSLGKFPDNFSVQASLPAQSYLQSSYGLQFDFYVNELKNQNKVAIVNPDGSFSNNANYGFFWFANDYYDLFVNPDSNPSRDLLDNLYITSATNEANIPTETSQIIANMIPDSPDPSCCDKIQAEVDGLTSWVSGNATIMNNNFAYLDEEINQLWTLENINDNVVGNVSPITSASGTKPAPLTMRGLRRELFAQDDVKLVNFFKNGKWGSMQYNGFNASGLGDITLEWLFGGYFFGKKMIADILFSLECPTGEKINDNDSYLAVGLGNNGHYVGRLGIQGSYDFDQVFRFRVNMKAFFEHGFSALEKLVPQFDGYDIFGLIPVKMDSEVSWNAGLFYIDGSLYANDYSGVTCGYQYWNKGKDLINPLDLVDLVVPDSSSTSGDSEEIALGVNFSGTSEMSKRISHMVTINFFSRLTNECFLNFGLSRIVAGKNVPKASDFFASIGLSY